MKHQDRNRIGLNHAGGPDNTHTGERPGGNRILLVGAWDLPLKMQYPQCCGRRQGAQGGHWFVALDLETIGTKITRITPSSPPPAPPTLSFCWAIETMLILNLHHRIRSHPRCRSPRTKKAPKSETICREIQVGWGMSLSSPSNTISLRIPAARDDKLHQNKMQKKSKIKTR